MSSFQMKIRRTLGQDETNVKPPTQPECIHLYLEVVLPVGGLTV
ncbi:MAG TPA: hypothetical protein V6C99_11235 [Oculatellaceae cyanobacterium]